jgi:hypothetical protein
VLEQDGRLCPGGQFHILNTRVHADPEKLLKISCYVNAPGNVFLSEAHRPPAEDALGRLPCFEGEGKDRPALSESLKVAVPKTHLKRYVRQIIAQFPE